MNNLSFDSKRCELMRQYLDSYLSNELLVETASEVVRHLESCESCSRDLESRMRVRDALHRAVVNRPVPESVRADVVRSLRESQPRSFMRPSTTRWAIGLACIAFVLLSLFTATKDKIFVHVFDWPRGPLEIEGLQGRALSAYLLSGGQPLKIEESEGKLRIELPPQPPDPNVSVIALRV